MFSAAAEVQDRLMPQARMLTPRLHQDAVVCVLASDAESEAVIQLAYAKAAKV
jgi:hypothetical protein